RTKRSPLRRKAATSTCYETCVADVEAGAAKPERSTAPHLAPPRSAIPAPRSPSDERSVKRPSRGVVLFAAFLGILLPGVARSDRTRVVIVLIDGLDASLVGPELMPTVWSLAHGQAGWAMFYPHGSAVMPTVTNTNHASILTGTYASAHGIVGNEIPNRD